MPSLSCKSDRLGFLLQKEIGINEIISKVGINGGAMNIVGYYENQGNKDLMTIQGFECVDGKSPMPIIYVDETKVIMKVLIDCKPNKIDLDLDLYKGNFIEVSKNGYVKILDDWNMYWKE